MHTDTVAKELKRWKHEVAKLAKRVNSGATELQPQLDFARSQYALWIEEASYTGIALDA